MNVVCSLCQHELEMAHRWFDWVCELGGTEGHKVFLIPASDTNIKDLLPKADKAFNKQVTIIIDYEAETSDWQSTSAARSASGPNSSFRQVAWHFHHFKLGYWFWCEFDCIPVKREWLNAIDEAYLKSVAGGKYFMGAHVLIDKVPEHMSGNGVYPQDVPSIAPSLVMRANWTPQGQRREYELAFDIAGAKEVVPQAHFTNLIQHKFRYEGFKSRKEFDAVLDPNAVVFHSDKKGTIYPYLRQNLTGNLEEKETASGRADQGDPGSGFLPENKIVSSRDLSPQETAVSRSDLVKETVSVLKKLCTSPRATNLVRKELKRQKVIARL